MFANYLNIKAINFNEEFVIERYGLFVRLVQEKDADFILQLRTDPGLDKYINYTIPDVEKQKQWIRLYKEREAKGEDYYFMFNKPYETRLGVCRIYNISTNDFTIGSWIFSPDAPIGSAILADIITREIAFELFPDRKLLFDVKKENISVNRYHATFQSEVIKEENGNIYYTSSQENFELNKKKFIRMFNK